MRTKSTIFSMLLITAVTLTFALTEANAGFPAPPGLPGRPGLPPPNLNVRVDGFLPAPPGVHIQMDSGRPYYVERHRRVYMEEDRSSRHYKNKHYKNRRHYDHEDRGREHGHDRR